ncbi:unnamed protein product [Absidia cylindrospora]
MFTRILGNVRITNKIVFHPQINHQWYSSATNKGPSVIDTSLEQQRLTHTDPTTGEARMVSVTNKATTKREATNELHTAKGNVLVVAQIAGIQAAKNTSQLIPLCHPLLLGLIDVRLWLDKDQSCVECSSLVQTSGKTGVEMEALTATSVALLTVFDMCKAASKHMRIEGIRVVEKKGGKSGHWQWNQDNQEQS